MSFGVLVLSSLLSLSFPRDFFNEVWDVQFFPSWSTLGSASSARPPLLGFCSSKLGFSTFTCVFSLGGTALGPAKSILSWLRAADFQFVQLFFFLRMRVRTFKLHKSLQSFISILFLVLNYCLLNKFWAILWKHKFSEVYFAFIGYKCTFKIYIGIS